MPASRPWPTSLAATLLLLSPFDLLVLALPAGTALAGFCAVAALIVAGLALRLPAE